MGWFNGVWGGGEPGGWLVTRHTPETQTRWIQLNSVSGTTQGSGRRGGAGRRLLKGTGPPSSPVRIWGCCFLPLSAI